MIVQSKAEFDAAMLTATSSTVIELPGGTIDWELIIDKPCTVLGSDTIIDIVDIDYAITITDACDISGIEVRTNRSGISLTDGATLSSITVEAQNVGLNITGNGSNCMLEEVRITDAETGVKLYNARKYDLSGCSATGCQIGIDIEGSSSVLGDTESDPSWISGTPAVLEADRTDRTHLITLYGCSSYRNKIGVRLINANNILFDSCNVYLNDSIGIWQTPSSYNNKFSGEIYGNVAYGVRNGDREGGLHDFDARQTWWGDITGPSGYGKGTGQKISTNVSSDPWLRDGTDPDVLLYPQTRKWIWSMLGYPIVRVELSEEKITECIEMAIDKFMFYQTPQIDWAYGNIGAKSYEVDLSMLHDKDGNPVSIKRNQVIEVAYQPYTDLFAQLTGSGTDFFLTYYMQGSGGSFLSDFYMAIGYRDDMELTLGIKPSYEFLSRIVPSTGLVKDMLRLYPKPDNAVKMGVKYSRTLTQEEVDSYTWIRKYALAWAKESLGRIRSKYSSLPSPTGETSLDGATLLAEAQQEKEALMTEILGLLEPLSFSIG